MSEEENHIPKWLSNLQENSWELELLISGGAIFSLFQFSDLFIQFIETVRMIARPPGSGPILMIGMFGIKVLTLGFVIHLLLRSFWLALVCVNYVYPNGIKEEKLKWKKPFKQNIGNHNDLQGAITKVDKYCGTVIYMSIISAFVILGITLVFVFIMFIMKFIDGGSYSVLGEWIFTVLFLGLITYLIDLLSFGLLRKIKYLSYLFYPFFKLYDVLTLRKYYQKSLWLFSTNVSKLKFFISSLLFAFVALCLAYNSTYRTQHWPNLFDQREFSWNMVDQSSSEQFIYMYEGAYMDEWNENSINSSGVSSKIQSGGLMEVFLRYDKIMDDLIHQTSTVDSLKSFDKLVEVNIDGTIIKELDWLPTRKLNESIIGITAMIPIHDLKNGKHIINMYSKFNHSDEHIRAEHPETYGISIPFWVDNPIINAVQVSKDTLK